MSMTNKPDMKKYLHKGTRLKYTLEYTPEILVQRRRPTSTDLHFGFGLDPQAYSEMLFLRFFIQKQKRNKMVTGTERRIVVSDMFPSCLKRF